MRSSRCCDLKSLKDRSEIEYFLHHEGRTRRKERETEMFKFFSNLRKKFNGTVHGIKIFFFFRILDVK